MSLVGKTFRIPHADSYAHYVVVAEGGEIDGYKMPGGVCKVEPDKSGDGWEDHSIRAQGNVVSRKFAIEQTRWEDRLQGLFARR